jgi:hypothetical protein
VNKALLDTDISSEVLKAIDHNVTRNATAYRQAHGLLTISVVTVMEVMIACRGNCKYLQYLSTCIPDASSWEDLLNNSLPYLPETGAWD